MATLQHSPPRRNRKRPEQFDADGPEVQTQAVHDVLDCDIEQPPTKKMRSLERGDSLAETRAMEVSRAKRVKRHASNASSHASHADNEDSCADPGDDVAGPSQATTISTFDDFTYRPEANEADHPLSQPPAAGTTILARRRVPRFLAGEGYFHPQTRVCRRLKFPCSC